ncbi:HNH endonuclease signature motif containing protein [Gordonia iterans]|uniref:HNH endonuclease signature motif containing protein n=1 Tax=Gordonia iterans TaxID=1004901 RepID=UPI00131E3367|nr:HNH endonuclease signature motif containing protein [Gordonia iterans]
MAVNGISYNNDSAAARGAGEGAVLDPAAFVATLSPAELLAVQTAAEQRLTAEATALVAAESDDGLLGLLDAREQTRRRAEVFDAALYIEISDRGVYRTAGHISVHQLYAYGARLGVGEAGRRRVTAEGIGAMGALTGERLEPHLAATATAAADGDAGGAHVAAVAEIMDKLPTAVTHDDRVKAEAMLADAARRLDPAAVTVVGNRILAWLDPDGTLADDHDRARRRTFNLQPQNRQLMSKVRALLTPVLRAKLEVILHQWATAGMNNPDDPDSPGGAADQPGLDSAVLAAAAERDTRMLGQRQHDALEALCDWALALAGQPAPTRIPSQTVVTVTDEDLARQAGIGWTATGTRIPVSDLVQFAADTVPYLAVFSKATGQILYMGRASRFATAAQRLALFARDRGCTAPGCTVPFIRTQAHHPSTACRRKLRHACSGPRMPDWTDDGQTDIDRLGVACGRHNRMNGTTPGHWESTVLTFGPDAGHVGWRPVGRGTRWQSNIMFHPERLAPERPAPDPGHGHPTAGAGPDDSGPPGDPGPCSPSSGTLQDATAAPKPARTTPGPHAA